MSGWLSSALGHIPTWIDYQRELFISSVCVAGDRSKSSGAAWTRERQGRSTSEHSPLAIAFALPRIRKLSLWRRSCCCARAKWEFGLTIGGVSIWQSDVWGLWRHHFATAFACGRPGQRRARRRSVLGPLTRSSVRRSFGPISQRHGL